MKYICSLIIALFVSSSVYADTNTGVGSNTNIQQAIVSILMSGKNVGGELYDASKSAIVSGIDLVKTQAPELVTEFIKWKFTEAIVRIVFGIALLIVGGYIIKRMYNSYDVPLVIVAGIFPTTIGVLVVGFNIMTAIQIWVAPKVYLIEYVVSSIRR